MTRLEGRVALITGGARGEAAAAAERLAREGAVVVTGDVLDEAGEETAASRPSDSANAPTVSAWCNSPLARAPL